MKADRTERLKQFVKASKKMDEDDIDFFWEDLEKVDKLEMYSMEACGHLYRCYKGALTPLMNKVGIVNHFS